MDRKDLERVPKVGWIAFLEGPNPAYPVQALQTDLERLRNRMEMVRTDPTTPDKILADLPLALSPAQTDALTNLMLGGYFAGRIWTLHNRFRCARRLTFLLSENNMAAACVGRRGYLAFGFILCAF